MELLFKIDAKDYDESWPKFVRPSVRGIIIRDGKIAMVHSLKFDYYKFPGGGIQRGETQEETLIREVKEEAGLLVIPESIRPYGMVHRIQKTDSGKIEIFVQDNYYYFCDIEDVNVGQNLDDYEATERFTLEWVEPETVIDVNLNRPHGPKDQRMVEREARVMEMLVSGGHFGVKEPEEPEIIESMDDYKDELEASYERMFNRDGKIDEPEESAPEWIMLREMLENKTVITGKITEIVKGGAVMEVEGVRGFIPASKLALQYPEDLDEFLNKKINVQVITADEEEKKLVLSAKELLLEQAVAEKNRRIQTLSVGNVVTGTVESLKDYGAFVALGGGVTGLLHISQIREARVNNIRSVLKEGQEVRVLITKIADGKISLSMRALEDALNKEKAEELPEEYSDGGEATTSFAALLKGIKL